MELSSRYVGNETLALGSGTIIRPDGIVAASASPLSLLKIKELKVTLGYQASILIFFSYFAFR